ncbi:MAG: rod shape-determining protein RodA [Bacteroidales bacterium]|nr:rod shape-determining protein RodA [Bacteroidales bacterium]
MNGRRKWYKTIDWGIVICYFLLFVIGWMSIYSSSSASEGASIFDMGERSGKQLLWFGISLVAGCLIMFVIRPQLWEVISPPAYLLVVLMLLAVLIFGATVNGSKSWFQLGPISFQPSELSKITTSLLLAHQLRSTNLNRAGSHGQFILAAIVAIPALIIFAEGETGTILVYLGFLFVLYREGLSGWWIALFGAVVLLFIMALITPLWVALSTAAVLVLAYYIFIRKTVVRRKAEKRKLLLASLGLLAAGALVVFSTSFVFDKVLKPYQKNRIEVLFGIKEDPSGVGYNVNQSMIAIGSGGLFGKGFTNGTQTSCGFVPEQSTDFIFCTIGEEAGFAGCLGVILLFSIMIWRIIKAADSSREPFTRAYGFCVAACIFMHMTINIGMTIGLMPVIGIPLPFISYGGSSLLAFSVMLFIFLSMVRHERTYF